MNAVAAAVDDGGLDMGVVLASVAPAEHRTATSMSLVGAVSVRATLPNRKASDAGTACCPIWEQEGHQLIAEPALQPKEFGDPLGEDVFPVEFEGTRARSTSSEHQTLGG